jgi:glycosyltransferase involved in cell wall biosynthesis
MKVAVVTPTIGAETLSRCIESVNEQTYSNITHYIFIDGEEHEKNIWYQLEDYENIKTVRLQENVGKGWYGHRVYAACSFLVNADVICYLDEDNWFEPNHVEKLVEVLEEGNDWAYSLRKIYDKDGKYICEDNCESLGKWPVYFNDQVFHIDTSSFAIRHHVATRIGHAWYGQWGADRQFFGTMKQHYPKYQCSNEYSLSYRLDGNPKSVTKEFFEKGNEVTKEKYGKDFPWLKREKEKIISEIGPGIKIVD